jgi:hypothetical protein
MEAGMTATIKINMDNAAFEGDPGAELGRILDELANRLFGPDLEPAAEEYILRDVNGNRVGELRITGGLEVQR